MTRLCAVACFCCVLLSPAVRGEEPAQFTREQINFYETKIRPLFVKHCIECHGDDEQSNNLRLDSVTALLSGGDSGPAAVPGKPDESLLIQGIRYDNEDFQMPPEEKLSQQQIADLELWVKQKLPHPPEAEIKQVRTDPVLDLEKERQFWAFRPPAPPELPPVHDTAWVISALDRFILAKLEAAGLAPAPAADKRVLIRRATFDLTGLPPTPAEVEAFVADDSPKAFEKLVDRLLASPQYGERWARHWLDVARYADSNGLDENVAHGNAWRYRDYVVDSFNRDKPIDQFMREQIAGDLLDHEDNPVLEREHKIATGFLSLGPKVLAEVDETKMEMDIIDEQIATFGQTFLGLTFGCARCHDHKFDPVLTSDYYGLAGIFRSTKTMDTFTKVAKWHENSIAGAGDLARKAEHDAKVADLQKRIDALVAEANKALQEQNDGKLPAKPESKYPKETQQALAKLKAEKKSLAEAAPEMPTAMGVSEEKPVDVRLHVRGSHRSLGKVIPRRIPVVFAGYEQDPFPKDHSGRKRLADWLTSSENPLTARVFVNRIWRWHFGAGLVRTPDNFGKLGERPTHPKLLDWLTVGFVRDGWSLKDLHRTIMLSSTYQMSSRYDARAAELDPENRLWWRANVRRLEAEPFRDAVLAVSGRLDPAVGGSLLTVKNRDYFFNHTSKDLANYDTMRRSLYLPVVRNHLYEVFRLFDYADASVASGDRASTTVVTQALFAINSDFMEEAADATAAELLADANASDAERIAQLYLRAYSRPPREDEVERIQTFLGRSASQLQADDPKCDARRRSWQLLCQAVFASNEFLYLR